MAKIQGVLGPIDTADLGFTLMHEHLMIANWSMRQAYKDWVKIDEHIEVRFIDPLKNIYRRTLENLLR